jgi:hypothetical protein
MSRLNAAGENGVLVVAGVIEAVGTSIHGIVVIGSVCRVQRPSAIVDLQSMIADQTRRPCSEMEHMVGDPALLLYAQNYGSRHASAGNEMTVSRRWMEEMAMGRMMSFRINGTDFRPG